MLRSISSSRGPDGARALSNRRASNRVVLAGVAVVIAGLVLATPGAGAASTGRAAAPAGAVAPMDTNPDTSEGNFVPLPQTSIVDTRSGLGLPQAKLNAGTVYSFNATGGTTGVPSTGVSAVALTLVTTNTSNTPWVTVWATGQPRPGTFNVFGSAGESQSGSAYIAPGTNGQISAYTGTGPTDLVVWVTGYFTQTDDTAGFVPVAGKRVVDTRNGIGAPQAKIPAGGSLTISTAAAGVPTTATGVVLTFTVYSTGNSYLNAAPPSATSQATSIGFPGASPEPTSITQITQSDGQMVKITAGPASALDVLVDVTGYFGASESGGGFTPRQARIYASNNPGSQSVPANGTLVVPITGIGGIPSDTGTVGSVSMDVSVLNPAAAGYMRVYAEGVPEPTSIQTITFQAGDFDTNSAVVSATAPATGRMVIHNFSTSPIAVYVDVQGWFSPATPPEPSTSAYMSLPEAFIVDSGHSVGISGDLAPTQTYSVPVLGHGGVPATGVTAVAYSVSALAPSSDDYLRMWPDGQAMPASTVLDVSAGTTNSNLAIVGVGTNGSVSVWAASATQITIAVTGYFTDTTSAGPGLTAVVQSRLVDTESAIGLPNSLAAGATANVVLTGGVIPVGSTGAVLQLSTPTPSASGSLVVWPTGGTQPQASALNFVSGKTSVAASVISLSASGSISITNTSSQPVDLTVDAEGYFTGNISSSGFSPVSCRAWDSRSPGNQAIAASATLDVDLDGLCGIGETTDSVVVNVGAITPGAPGSLTTWAADSDEPTTAGTPLANGSSSSTASIVELGSSDTIAIANHSDHPINVVLDVEGSFQALQGRTYTDGASPLAIGPGGGTTGTYLDLGDSYAAGPGLGDYINNGCRTDQNVKNVSSHGYGPLLAVNVLTTYAFHDRACTGAKVTDMLVVTQDPSADVRLITLSIGGNDIRFHDLVECILKHDVFPNSRCNVSPYMKTLNDQLPGLLSIAYQHLGRLYPNAEVVVVNYPLVYGIKDCLSKAKRDQRFASQGEPFERQLGVVIGNAVASATNAGFFRGYFLNLIPSFLGHSICAPAGGASDWFQTSNYTNYQNQSVFHPNRTGHVSIYKTIRSLPSSVLRH